MIQMSLMTLFAIYLEIIAKLNDEKFQNRPAEL